MALVPGLKEVKDVIAIIKIVALKEQIKLLKTIAEDITPKNTQYCEDMLTMLYASGFCRAVELLVSMHHENKLLPLLEHDDFEEVIKRIVELIQQEEEKTCH